MNNPLLNAAWALALGLGSAGALAQTVYGDVAKVLSATPIRAGAGAPGRDCRIEPVRAYEERPAEETGAPVTLQVERCAGPAESGDRIVGYDVRYEYNGREFRVRMPHDPGPQMAVNVEVRPPSPAYPRRPPLRPYRGTLSP